MMLTGKENHAKRDLSALLEKRWYAYALAGAGAIAVAPNAQATIVFTAGGGTSTATCVGLGCNDTGNTLTIDLDHNSVNDFSLFAKVSSSSGQLHFVGTNATPAGAYTEGGLTTPSLAAGTSIGSAGPGFSYRNNAHIFNPSSVWNNGDSFFGLEFHDPLDANPGDENYGWVELQRTFSSVASTTTYNVTIVGYAFEETANTPIMAGQTVEAGAAPEPGTAGLMLMALGAGALAVWRKRKQAQQGA